MKTNIFILLFSFFAATAFAQKNLTQYVNPFMGTAGHGHVFPGATVPFGMVQLSPDNGRAGWDWCSGYNYSDSLIAGFSHTHLSGTGIGDLCDISFMPAVLPNNYDESKLNETQFKTKFIHKNEKAEPGFYSVILSNKIKIELAASLRTGVQRYTFPEEGNAYVKIDLGFAINWDSPVETYIKIENPTRIVGYRLSKGWANDQRVYFVSEFSKPIAASWIGNSKTISQTNVELKDKDVKAIFRFDKKQVLIRTAISSVSIENAKVNLIADKVNWDFQKIKTNASLLWNKELNKILVKSKDKNLLTTFYTSLYRTMLAPVIYGDADGSYKGADGKIHKAEGYTKYSIFSLWDTFRAAHPLFTITQPERVGDMINSMMSHYHEYGLLPVWELDGNETNCMIGYHAIPVIADAILKGINGFDKKEAYSAMKKSAMQDHYGLKYFKELGYIPAEKENESVSKTLEYAYDDWCIAQIAKYFGNDEDYNYFAKRSQNYKNIFDSSTGFMRGKLSDGSWRAPFNPKRSDHNTHDYTEGNAWQYSWFVLQDVAGLINLHGGKEKFSAKLDSLFTIDSKVEGDNASPDISGMIGQYAHGNEPSHHTAYMFNFTGEPWRTQELVNQIMKTLYNSSTEGLCGNEDCGQMSAWYVLSALGIYSFNSADQNYVIGSPRFGKATVYLSNGNKFVITAKNVSAKNIFIQSATLNGKELSRSFITHKELENGGMLVFNMSSTPNKQLWNSENSLPPSFTSAGSSIIDKKVYAEKVKQEFLHAWNGYKKYAWGHDDLSPLTKTFHDWYSESLLMSPVDAFDTMILMGLKDEAAEAKKLILEKLSFDKDISVKNFEITIRLLGGLLSAYQLDGDKKFLDLAADLGNRLLPAYKSPTGMPYTFVNLKTGKTSGAETNPAEIGTSIIEMGTLSKLTGNPIYFEKSKRAVTELYNRRSKIGLVGYSINIETGVWTNSTASVGCCIDSYYEYLLKGAILFGDKDLRRMWNEHIKSINKYLADARYGNLWYGFADMNSGKRTGTFNGALDAFFPALLTLGGDLNRAEQLQENNFKMWNLYGIEPEQLDYSTMKITEPNYELRPENFESAFYLYRYTKDEKYLQMGVTFFNNLVKYCRTDEGYAALKNVVSKEKKNTMESFFFAETLKYLYLIFASNETLDLRKVVFNTEAHPIRILGKK